MPLRVRLALFGGGVVALALVVFGLLLYGLLARSVSNNQDDALRARAGDAVLTLHGLPQPQTPVAAADLGKSNDVFIELVASDGSVLYATGLLNGTPPVAGTALFEQSQRLHGAFATHGSIRLYALPYTSGYIVTGQSTRVPQSSLSGIVVFLVVSAVPALIAAFIASWLVAGRALAPLKGVAVAARDIGETRDFGRRLPPKGGSDEVAILTSSFNGMLNQLQDAFESQRRFVADASHELRTPLTTIQGNAALLASRVVTDEVRHVAATDVVDESARMGRLIDRMLTLARADGGLRLTLARLDFKALVDEICRQAHGLRPEIQLSGSTVDVWVDGDEDALRQLVWILLDNAIRFARSAVSVHLEATTEWARLIVADDGPGVGDEKRERIFERFYRADESRTGAHAGLGLSIARWIVTQHGGRVVAGEAIMGGAALLVDLPLLSGS